MLRERLHAYDNNYSYYDDNLIVQIPDREVLETYLVNRIKASYNLNLFE